MTREKAIEILKFLRECSYVDTFEDAEYEALDMAIASLKTDEAYQLEYENRDFVEIPKGITNGEVLQAVFPNIELGETRINRKRYFLKGETIETFDLKVHDNWWNALYKPEKTETCKGCLEPCIMYEPDMRGCKKKVTERGE